MPIRQEKPAPHYVHITYGTLQIPACTLVTLPLASTMIVGCTRPSKTSRTSAASWMMSYSLTMILPLILPTYASFYSGVRNETFLLTKTSSSSVYRKSTSVVFISPTMATTSVTISLKLSVALPVEQTFWSGQPTGRQHWQHQLSTLSSPPSLQHQERLPLGHYSY